MLLLTPQGSGAHDTHLCTTPPYNMYMHMHMLYMWHVFRAAGFLVLHLSARKQAQVHCEKNAKPLAQGECFIQIQIVDCYVPYDQ